MKYHQRLKGFACSCVDARGRGRLRGPGLGFRAKAPAISSEMTSRSDSRRSALTADDVMAAIGESQFVKPGACSTETLREVAASFRESGRRPVRVDHLNAWRHWSLSERRLEERIHQARAAAPFVPERYSAVWLNKGHEDRMQREIVGEIVEARGETAKLVPR